MRVCVCWGWGGGLGGTTSTHPIHLETGPTWLHEVPKFCPRPTAACLCVHAASARSEGGMAGRLRRKTTTTTMMQQHCESLPGASQNRLASKSIKATPPPPPPPYSTPADSISCGWRVAAARFLSLQFKFTFAATNTDLPLRRALLRRKLYFCSWKNKTKQTKNTRNGSKIPPVMRLENLVVNLQLCTKATCDN